MDRRQALYRLFASTVSGAIWAVATSNQSSPGNPLPVVSGERLGQFRLGTSMHRMANELGQPQERSVHAAISLESLQKVSLLAGVPVDQLPTEAVPETTFLNYHYRGLSLKFVNEVLMGIYAFTGLPVSNDTTPWGNFFADAPSSSFVDLASMDRVTGLLGRPQRSGSSVLCDIPNAWMDYNGLFFDFQAESGLLARVSVHKK